MAEKIVIAELEIDVNALLKSTAEVKASIDSLRKSQVELTKQGDTSSEQFVQNVADLKSLSSAYNSNLKAISDSTNAQAESANRTQLVALALQSEVTSIKDAREQNSLLNKLRNDSKFLTKEGKEEQDKLNKKLNENNEIIKENVDNYARQKIGIGDYKTAITGALQETGLFGGQLGGVSKIMSSFSGVFSSIKTSAKEGSDQIKNAAASTEGMSFAQKSLTIATNIGTGATRIFTLALAATGIGLIIAAVALLIGYFKTFDPIVDKVEQGMAALGAVVRVVQQALAGLFTLDFSKFATLGGDMAKAASAAAKLEEKIQDLADAQSSQDVANAKASQMFNKLILQSKNRSISEEERIALIEKAEKIETENFAKRMSLAGQEQDAAKENVRIKGALTDKEMAKLKELGETYARELQQNGRISEEDVERVKKASLAKISILDESTQRLEKASNRKDKLEDDSIAKKEKADADAVANAEKNEARKKAILDNALAKTQAELDLFLSAQGVKAKSLEEELKLAETIYEKQLEINQKDFNASEKTAVDKLALQTANNNAQNALLTSQAELVVSNAQRELDVFIETNKSKLDAQKFLTDASVQQERERLDLIAKEQKEFADLEKLNGTTNKQAYDDAIKVIDADTATKKEEVRLAKVQADAEREAIDLENRLATSENEFVTAQEDLNKRYNAEVLAAGKNGAALKLINEKFAIAQKQIDTTLLNAKLESYKQTFNSLAGMFGEHTVIAKAAAIAQVGIDTYQKAFESFAQAKVYFSNPLTASLGVNAAIQGGLTIAQGAVTAAKIAGVKFEHGGTMEVGGNRHSEGGTKFVGSDGTRFEAEKGELIGVLNRGASSQFMAFNNAFGSKGQIGTSYAQTGGIIARGMDGNNVELQAMLTANAVSQMPSPIVSVEEISSVANRVAVIENGASF